MMECYRCHGYGHKQKDCTNQHGVVMQITPDGSTVPVIEEEDEYLGAQHKTGKYGKDKKHLN